MLSFYYCFIVDSIGRSGGLALFWRKPFGLINFSQNFINVEVHHPRTQLGDSQDSMAFQKEVEENILGTFYILWRQINNSHGAS